MAFRIFPLSCLAPALIAALLAARADALSITGLSIVLGGTNTADGTTNSGQNFAQTTSAVSTPLTPAGAPDTLGSFSEFITRYAMMVAADRQNTTGSTNVTMISSFTITFTVDNPTGATVQIDIDTLRVGSLTNVTDSAGGSVITLGAVVGSVNSGVEPGLAAPAVPLSQTASADSPFSQAGTTVTILTSALTSNYVLQFDYTSSVASTWDEGAIRMGMAGNLGTVTGPVTADDYPGAVGSPRIQNDDGHFVEVRATIIELPIPEPGTASLLVFGMALLARRARARTRK